MMRSSRYLCSSEMVSFGRCFLLILFQTSIRYFMHTVRVVPAFVIDKTSIPNSFKKNSSAVSILFYGEKIQPIIHNNVIISSSNPTGTMLDRITQLIVFSSLMISVSFSFFQFWLWLN